MVHVLAYTSPARGHVEPLLPVLTALQGAGADVSARTLPDQLPRLQALGIAARPVDPAVASIQLEDWRVRGQRAALRASVATFAARAEHDAADLSRAIAEEEPDLLLVDVNSWGALTVARASGLPYAVLAPYPLALRSQDAPPFGPGLPPARGRIGRLRDRVLSPLILGTVERATLPPLNRTRSAWGLAPLHRYDDLLTEAPLVVSLTAEPFEYHRRDWPGNVRLVGPCVDPDLEEAPPAWLDEIEQPIVLVTTSSEFQQDHGLVDAAIEGLRGTGVHVVATVPAGDRATVVSDEAHVVAWAPHTPLLRTAACAVTHGGMGATQRALAHGVPVCAVPFGRDQHEVARRVEVAGAGTRLTARRLTPQRLREHVLRAIELRPGAARVAAGFAAAPGAKGAADELLGLHG